LGLTSDIGSNHTINPGGLAGKKVASDGVPEVQMSLKFLGFECEHEKSLKKYTIFPTWIG